MTVAFFFADKRNKVLKFVCFLSFIFRMCVCVSVLCTECIANERWRKLIEYGNVNAVILSAAKCLANYPNPKQSQSELTAIATRKKSFKHWNRVQTIFFFKKLLEIGVDFTFYHAQRNQWTLFEYHLTKLKKKKGEKKKIAKVNANAMVFIVHVRIWLCINMTVINPKLFQNCA